MEGIVVMLYLGHILRSLMHTTKQKNLREDVGVSVVPKPKYSTAPILHIPSCLIHMIVLKFLTKSKGPYFQITVVCQTYDCIMSFCSYLKREQIHSTLHIQIPLGASIQNNFFSIYNGFFFFVCV